MKKSLLAGIVCFYVLSLLALVSAQTASPTPMPETLNLIGAAVGAGVLIVILAFIVYAGFKVIKKWSEAD